LNITIINDQENKIVSSEFLNANFDKLFSGEKLDATLVQIGRGDVASCMGCFGCWIKTPGECVIKDKGVEINRKVVNSDIVIYITPVIFGQYSYNMKNVIDRGLGKSLPFFEKFNGRTVHPRRYDKMPTEYVIGCIESDNKDDQDLFLDIHMKYRRDIKKVYICEEEGKMGHIIREILAGVNDNEEN